MIEYKLETLLNDGYTIENVKITSAELSMADYNSFTLLLVVEGNGMGCVYGGYVLGKGSLDADKFEGSAKGLESIMRIMDVVGVDKFTDLEGQYARVATKGWGSSVKIIGNVIKDKWFDYGSFFDEVSE